VDDNGVDFRQRVFDALDQRQESGLEVFTAAQLAQFDIDGTPTRLIANSRGIWNPSHLETTLAVVSSADGPYNDRELRTGVWRYDYEGTSLAGSNTKLRRAYEQQTPIILFRKIAANTYLPFYPVYVIADHPAELYFELAVSEAAAAQTLEDPGTRSYVERMVKERVHQREFRTKVLLAYENQCTICRLRHRPLLDAAHILPDSHPKGRAVVPNGLSLCKIHHSAYDSNLLGIDPLATVHINRELLTEIDGPMLKHGLQEMHGLKLRLPRQRAMRPESARLEERFVEFQAQQQ
jgi:putative restriction endonuclease